MSNTTVQHCDPDNTKRNVPWGVADATLIALVFFFAPCLLLSIILMLPRGHIFFLPGMVEERGLIWSKPMLRQKSQNAKFTPEELNRGASTSCVFEYRSASNDATATSERSFLSFSSFIAEPNKQTNSATALNHNGGFEISDAEEEELVTAHPLTELLVRAKGSSKYYWAVALAFLAGVVAAPLVEEFLFRVVLQGALEKTPDNDSTSSRWSRATMAILVPATLFAAIHYREPANHEDLDLLFLYMMITPVGLFVTLAFGLLWLKLVRGATRRDLGIVWRDIPFDFVKGIGAFLIMIPILAPAIVILRNSFPNTITDPIPIFILAVGLGILFHRTRRYAAVVGMHFGLNFFSFALLVFR